MPQIEVICESCAGSGFSDEFSHTDGHYTRNCEDCKGAGAHTLDVPETESSVSSTSTGYVIVVAGLPNAGHQFFVEWLYDSVRNETVGRTSDDIREAHVFTHYEDALVEFNESMRHKDTPEFHPMIVRVACEHVEKMRIVPSDEAVRDDAEARVKAELETVTPPSRFDCN